MVESPRESATLTDTQAQNTTHTTAEARGRLAVSDDEVRQQSEERRDDDEAR
jgi:hypothetical protein